MNSPATCPADEDLMPLLAGETIDVNLATHIGECNGCRCRVDLLKSDLAALRSVSLMFEEETVALPSRPANIGKYLVVGRLDSGGQADVFRAVHPTLDTELVIKLSRRGVGRLSDHRALLVAEGKLLAKMDHPGLARIYDLDFHEDQPFLAMEYVRGPNLRRYVEENKVSPDETAALLAQVARALNVVHRHGIVHQDIKPQNILVDEKGNARLIDFGMARLRHAWDKTGESVVGGTAPFMAPEQARLENEAIGPRTDFFALGGVLYFMLTGQPPFQGEDVEQSLEKARQCDFDRSALDKPGIPRRLRDICLKAMSPTPAERYASADELAAALEHFARRRQRRVIFGLAAAAAVLVAAGIAAWSAIPKPQPPIIIERPAVAEAPYGLQVLVTRGGESLNLSAALPLDPDKDRFQIVGRVPTGQHSVLIHFDAKGKVERLKVRESPADGYTKIVYPADGRLAELDKGKPGTEFVLLCSAERDDQFKELADLLKLTLNHSPAIASRKILEFSRNETQQPPRQFDEAEPDPTVDVEIKLDYLRKELRKLSLSYFQGVAYSRP